MKNLEKFVDVCCSCLLFLSWKATEDFDTFLIALMAAFATHTFNAFSWYSYLMHTPGTSITKDSSEGSRENTGERFVAVQSSHPSASCSFSGLSILAWKRVQAYEGNDPSVQGYCLLRLPCLPPRQAAITTASLKGPAVPPAFNGRTTKTWHTLFSFNW